MNKNFLRKSDLILNIIIKTVILILFVWFSFYKMRINLFYITVELLLFSFVNSFIIKDKKISFDMELLSFQMVTVFYLERKANFNWRDVPEKIFDNDNYAKILFILVFTAIFIYLRIKNENKFLKKYTYYMFFILVIIENILEIEIMYSISLIFSIPSAILTYTRIDIAVIGVIMFLLSQKDKKIFLIYNFIILCLFVRYMTIYLKWGIL